MDYLILRCPICNQVLSNPELLREHRLREHRSIYSEATATGKPAYWYDGHASVAT
jgi:hypothetical protein